MNGCDESKFTKWLEHVCDVNNREAKKITDGLAEKCSKMLAV